MRIAYLDHPDYINNIKLIFIMFHFWVVIYFLFEIFAIMYLHFERKHLSNNPLQVL